MLGGAAVVCALPKIRAAFCFGVRHIQIMAGIQVLNGVDAAAHVIENPFLAVAIIGLLNLDIISAVFSRIFDINAKGGICQISQCENAAGNHRAAVRNAGFGGAGGKAGEVAHGIDVGCEGGIAEAIVDIPVPHLYRVRPHTVDQVIGAVAVGAVPDLAFSVPACPVAPDQEITAAHARVILSEGELVLICNRCINGIELTGIPAAALAAGIIIITRWLARIAAAGINPVFRGMVERPLEAVPITRIALRAVVTKHIIGEVIDAVVNCPSVANISIYSCILRIVPNADLQIRIQCHRGAAIEVVIEGTHGVALIAEHRGDLVDVADEGRIVQGATDFIRADVHLAAAKILEELGIAVDQCQGQILGVIVGDVQGAPVAGGSIAIAGVPPIELGGTVGVILSVVVKGKPVVGAGGGVAVDQVIAVAGHIHSRDDFDVILLCRCHNVANLRGTIVAAGIGVRITACPRSRLIAANPAEIIAVGICAVRPDVHMDALVFGHVQFQCVVAHPRHFADQVLDPLDRPILSGAVELNRTFPCVRAVCYGAAINGAVAIDDHAL